MKATLSFNLPEEQEEFETAVKAFDYKIALEEVWEKVFRPAFKHGYAQPELAELSERDYVVIEKLADIFREILNDRIHNH